ncbi:MAG: hypothetical protein LBC70_08205 [Chitinispirillales bacterium]|nr:hypothetical protein [Chitinispirillales bacterium]
MVNKKYGRLYSREAALNACPAGWRLPDDRDLDDLILATGGGVAGTNLKSTPPDWDGTDEFGFSAMPGGIRSTNFSDIGRRGRWWSSGRQWSGGIPTIAWGMNSGITNMAREFMFAVSLAYSVRCVQE